MRLIRFEHLEKVQQRIFLRALLRDIFIRGVSIGGVAGRIIRFVGGVRSRSGIDDDRRIMKQPVRFARKIVCFAHYDPHGRVSKADRDAIHRYKSADYQVFLASTAPSLSADALDLVDGAILRTNRGFDFASWSAFIREFLPKGVRLQMDHLVMTNNSMYGPLWDVAPLLSQAKVAANVVGLTKSHEFAPHLQSYFLSFDAHALASEAFDQFWSRNFSSKRKWDVIANGELLWARFFSRAGLTTKHLIPQQGDISRNELTFYWSELVAAGLPYLKKSLFRQNYDGLDLGNWRKKVAVLAPGYDAELIGSDLDL